VKPLLVTLIVILTRVLVSADVLWDAPADPQPPGTVYRLYASVDLVNWVVIAEVPAVDGQEVYRVSRSNTGAQEFYKVCAVADGWRAWAGGLVEPDTQPVLAAPKVRGKKVKL